MSTEEKLIIGSPPVEMMPRTKTMLRPALTTSPDARYLGLREGDGLAGFVIFQQVKEPLIRLRRIAVDATDKGTGTRILRAALDWVFGTFPAAEAITLGVARANDRARHIYLREGFVDDGEDEVHFNMVLTRRAWAERRGA